MATVSIAARNKPQSRCLTGINVISVPAKSNSDSFLTLRDLRFGETLILLLVLLDHQIVGKGEMHD
jgi:hypothetical protein